MQVDPSIFKAYDIRGIVGVTLTEETARAVGRVRSRRGSTPSPSAATAA